MRGSGPIIENTHRPHRSHNLIRERRHFRIRNLNTQHRQARAQLFFRCVRAGETSGRQLSEHTSQLLSFLDPHFVNKRLVELKLGDDVCVMALALITQIRFIRHG